MRSIHAASLAWLVLGCGGAKPGPDAAPIDGARIDAAPAADAGPCPDEHGAYSIVVTGQGCGDVSASAPECITQTSCAITFASNPPAGGKALNGTANLGADGSFSGAAIAEGTVNRTGCVGTWNAASATATVDCGGVGTTQSCRATLTRTSTSCN